MTKWGQAFHIVENAGCMTQDKSLSEKWKRRESSLGKLAVGHRWISTNLLHSMEMFICGLYIKKNTFRPSGNICVFLPWLLFTKRQILSCLCCLCEVYSFRGCITPTLQLHKWSQKITLSHQWQCGLKFACHSSPDSHKHTLCHHWTETSSLLTKYSLTSEWLMHAYSDCRINHWKKRWTCSLQDFLFYLPPEEKTHWQTTLFYPWYVWVMQKFSVSSNKTHRYHKHQ